MKEPLTYIILTILESGAYEARWTCKGTQHKFEAKWHFFCLSVLLKSCILTFLSILTFQSIYNGSPFSSPFTHSRGLLHLTLATQLTLNNETASVVLHNGRAVLTCLLTMPNTCLYRENKQRLINNLWLSRGEGGREWSNERQTHKIGNRHRHLC